MYWCAKKQLFSENLTKKMACRIKTPKACTHTHLGLYNYKNTLNSIRAYCLKCYKSSSPDAKMRILIEIRVTFKFDFCNVYSVIMIIRCK